MRAFLAVAAKNHERGVVLVAEKFKARGIFKRVYGILFGEAYGVRAFDGMEVCEKGVDKGGGRRATEKESRLGILYWEGLLFGEGPL